MKINVGYSFRLVLCIVCFVVSYARAVAKNSTAVKNGFVNVNISRPAVSNANRTLASGSATVGVRFSSSQKPSQPDDGDMMVGAAAVGGPIMAQDTRKLWISEIFDEAKRNFDMNETNNTRCKEDYRRFKSHFSNHTLWAIRMMESSEWPTTSILAGTVVHMGNWFECLLVSAAGIKGQFCLPSLTYEYESTGHFDTVESPSQDTSVWMAMKMYEKDPARISRRHIMWAMCIPASCTSNDLAVSLDKAVQPIFAKQKLNVSFNVDPLRCTKNEEYRYPIEFYIFLVAMAVIVLLCAISTIFDLINKIDAQEVDVENTMRRLCRIFSVAKNSLYLASDTGSLHPLYNALKMGCMIFVIFAHRKRFAMSLPLYNTERIELEFKKKTIDFAHTALIDIFFMISGYLTFHYGIVGVKRGGAVYLIGAVVVRWIRLMLPLAVAIYFVIFTLPYLNQGPLWNDQTAVEVENCKATWWLALLALTNVFELDKQCLLVTWYISVDIQLTIVASFLLFVLHKNRTLGVLATFGAFIASIVTTFVVVYKYHFTGILRFYLSFLKDPRKSDEFDYHYVATYTRASSYIVGFFVALMADILKEKKYSFPKPQLRILTPVLFISSELYQYYSFVFYDLDRPYNAFENAFYAATHRWIFVLPYAYIMCAASVSGFDAIFEKVSRLKIFTVFGRLSFSAYLLNTIILVILNASQADLAPSSTNFNLYWIFCGDLFMTYSAAYLFFLLIEAPILNFTKIILSVLIRKATERTLGRKKSISWTSRETQTN